MKRIKYFETFVNEDAAPSANGQQNKKDFEHLPKLKTVVDKEFFIELKEHVFYWLTYDFLKQKYVITSLENDERSVTIWFSDNETIPKYEYKVTYTPHEISPLVEKIEEIKMSISIYETESQDLLKQTEMKIGLKYLNAESFNRFINKVKKRIIAIPKDGEDIETFKRKEKRRLGDNIY